MTSPSNIVAFPGAWRAPVEETSETPATENEVRVALLEAAVANSEKALLVLASALQHQRALLGEIKAAEGWSWSGKASAGLFGEAVLYQTHAVKVVEREAAP